MASSFIDRLKKIFLISQKKVSSNSEPIIYPGQVAKDKDGNRRISAVKFPTDIQQLYDLWLNDSFDTRQTIKGRIDRYADLDYAYYNNAIFSTAVDLYSDEMTQSDAQSDIIHIKAKSKDVENYIVEFFEKIGMNNTLLKSIADDLSLYADSFHINGIDKNEGIINVTPLEPHLIKDRLEFSAVKEYEKQVNRYQSYFNKNIILQKLKDIMTNEDLDYTMFYKSYLFGFVLNQEMVLPPWAISHYRRFSTKSEFFPFGRPIMINAIAPFRHLQAAKNLLAVARANSFPIKKFSVKMDKGMTQAQQWDSVAQARDEFYNLADQYTNKETFSSAAEIWTPADVLDIEVIESKVNLADILDIELLQDNLIIATRIPKGYLITDRGAFGQSGQSLLQQSKIFGRSVYTLQTAMLETLVNLVRTQFAITNSFSYDEEFEISMNFPVIEQTSDQLRMKKDTLDLAKDIIELVSGSIGLVDGEELLPVDVQTQILSDLSFLDKETLDTWISKSKDDIQKISKPVMESVRKKIKTRMSNNLANECYFKAKKNRQLTEGLQYNKHYYVNNKITSSEKTYFDLLTVAKEYKLNG